MGKVIVNDGGQHAYVNTTGVYQRLSALESEILDTVYYNEITYQKLNDSVTGIDYFVTTIPNKDSKGNLIKLKHGYANDQMNKLNVSGMVDGESARSFGERHNACFVSNASIWDTTTTKIKGVQIQNGVVLQENDGGTSWTLGITDDNTLKLYNNTVRSTTMIADGVLDTITGFFPLIMNGVPSDSSIYSVITNPSEEHPRNSIGQMSNNDIIYITTDTNDDVSGFTYSDLIRLYQSLGVFTAYCLDGGGSTQTVVRSVTLNKPTDEKGTKERQVADFLYVVKESAYPQNVTTESHDIGFVNKRALDALGGLNNLGVFSSFATTVTDLTNLVDSGMYWVTSSATGVPNTNNSWGIFHFKVGTNSALQVAYPYNSANAYPRYRIRDGSGNWQSWVGIDVGNFGLKPITVTDFNSVPPISGKYYGVNGSIANAPATSSSWVVDHTQIGSLTAIQVAFSYDSLGNYPAKKRICDNTGTWQAWTAL